MKSGKWIALVAIVMSWCIVAQASGVVPGCEMGPVAIEELVMQGFATADDLIVASLAGRERSLESLRDFAAKFNRCGGAEVESIVDEFYLFHLKPSNATFEEKAKCLSEANTGLTAVLSSLSASGPREAASAPDTSWKRRTTPGVEPNLYFPTFATPGDAGFAQQCGLRAIQAEKAWDTVNPPYASDVNVAIVDSGLAYQHSDLYPHAKPASNADLDRNGHGTHVAGIIGALSDGSTGIVGVTWETRITAYKFLDASGRGTLKDALRQIRAAINGGAHIVVLAWGSGVYSRLLFEMLDNEKDRVLFVAAAGNYGKNTCKEAPIYPAAYDLENLISVMATTCDDVVPRFSNFGEETVDLAAPGEGLHRTLRIYSTVLNNRWGHSAGTSMSAAFVAGAAALVLQPSLTTTRYTPKQIKCWLNWTAKDLGVLAGKNRSGGRLDLAEAVKRLDESKCPR